MSHWGQSFPWFELPTPEKALCETCGDVFLSSQRPKPCKDCKGPACAVICDDCLKDMPPAKTEFPTLGIMVTLDELGIDEHLCKKCLYETDIQTPESTP